VIVERDTSTACTDNGTVDPPIENQRPVNNGAFGVGDDWPGDIAIAGTVVEVVADIS